MSPTVSLFSLSTVDTLQWSSFVFRPSSCPSHSFSFQKVLGPIPKHRWLQIRLDDPTTGLGEVARRPEQHEHGDELVGPVVPCQPRGLKGHSPRLATNLRWMTGAGYGPVRGLQVRGLGRKPYSNTGDTAPTERPIEGFPGGLGHDPEG